LAARSIRAWIDRRRIRRGNPATVHENYAAGCAERSHEMHTRPTVVTSPSQQDLAPRLVGAACDGATIKIGGGVGEDRSETRGIQIYRWERRGGRELGIESTTLLQPL